MTKINNYYMDEKYVYKVNDPMAKTTERMLKAYFRTSKKRVFVKKWYRGNGTVEIWAEAA